MINSECETEDIAPGAGGNHPERKLGGKLEFDQSIKVTDFESGRSDCDAKVAIEYWREGDEVVVESTVENKGCAASHGEYKLVLRTSKGATRASHAFKETWLRTADGPLRLEHRYPVGADEELKRVKLVTYPKTRCLCD